MLLAAAAAGIVVILIFYAAYPLLNSTKISTIMSDPSSFNGKQVSVFGSVTQRYSGGFILSDGTGSVLIVWQGTLPAVGTSNVYVTGTLTGGGIQIGGLQIKGTYITATHVSVWPFE